MPACHAAVDPGVHPAPGPFTVLTGGPGAGKTTLINALRDLGLATAPEAGRAIICEQAAIGGPPLPWADTRLFFETIMSWDMRSYRQAQATAGPVFFDRGIPDVAGGYAMLGLDVPAHVRAAIAAFRYHPLVFLAPAWREIYTTDTERKQSFAEAERTCEAMAAAYTEAGYELIRLPFVPLAGRAAVGGVHGQPPPGSVSMNLIMRHYVLIVSRSGS